MAVFRRRRGHPLLALASVIGSFFFSNDAMTDQYYTDDALQDPYVYED